ncbi:MAG: hypothetical protein PUD20_11650, partial [bacterium]|nr:hypothetical protein [bacterium]
LNAAYNTYETVMNAEGISIIQGYVYDKNMAPLPEATIELYDESFEKLIFCANVKTDGTYRIYVPSEAYEYNIRVIKDGYGDCDIYRVVISNELVGVYQDSIYLFESGLDDKEVSIILGDALNYNEYGTGMVLLSNAKVNVRKGINNRTGSQIVATGITDNSGYISLILPPGVYTLEVMADGYETMYYTIIVNPLADCIYEFYAAPELRDGECAIVLTWGASPSDLDSHLFTTSGSGSSHVWYGRMWDDSGNNLDVDDTSSYGPETMTIDSLSATDYYKFCVVDFTDCSNGDLRSYSMSQSQATVNVYTSDGLVGTYPVPTNTPGVIWEVFEIRNGRLTPIQRYYDNVTNKDWWHQDK